MKYYEVMKSWFFVEASRWENWIAPLAWPLTLTNLPSPVGLRRRWKLGEFADVFFVGGNL